MAVTWTEVPQQVLDLASSIIEAHHPDLLDAKIGFIFRSEAQSNGDKLVIGKAQKVSEKLRVFMDFDFLIWLAEDAWKNMLPVEKQALVDHELTHCKFDDGKASMRPHDVEEFYSIINRYGLWKPDLAMLGRVVEKVKQDALPGLEKQDGQVLSVKVIGGLAEALEW